MAGTVDTLHERVGEEEQLRGRTDLGTDGDTSNGAWGRVIGHYGHRDGDPVGIYGWRTRVRLRLRRAADRPRHLSARRTRTAPSTMPASTVAFGHGEVDVQHNLLGRQFKGGTDSFDAGTIGGYWTRFWENNAYLDGVVQATWYDVTAQSLRSKLFGFPDQDTSGVGLAASLEGGYPFYFGDGWQLEPQASSSTRLSTWIPSTTALPTCSSTISIR